MAGAAEAWGNNDYGQLGDGTLGEGAGSSSPLAAVAMGSGVTTISAGVLHGLAIRNGGLYAWGSNDYGELGNGTATTEPPYAIPTPGPVAGMGSGVSAVAGGYSYSLAIQNGGLYAWGYNYFGQLGNGTTSGFDANPTPIPVVGMSSGVTAVAAGNYHGLAIQNGGLYAWGDNAYGQLGNGTVANSDVPVPVTSMSSGVTAIAGGVDHSLAIMNGALYAWGRNDYGQLGDGTTSNSNVPVAVSGMGAGVTSCSGSLQFSLAIKGGNVYAWGNAGGGELGNGDSNSGDNYTSPVEIDPTDLKLIVAVAAGLGSGYALSSDGSLWVWGDNTSGQLGLGTTTTDFTLPHHLLPPAGEKYTAIASDDNFYDPFALAVLSPAPEPASLGLLGMAALATLLRRRPRQGSAFEERKDGMMVVGQAVEG